MGTKKKAGLWITWAVLWPLGLWWIGRTFGLNMNGHVADYIFFILLTVVVAYFPIEIRGTDLVFTQGVLLAIFLEFGLLAEVIAQQIATLAFLLFLRVGRKDLERYPMNLLMFLAVSLISGLAFFAAGGKTGSPEMDSFSDAIPVIVYVLSIFLSNHFLLFVFQSLFRRSKRVFRLFMGKDAWWEAVMTLLMAPIAIALYVLYKQMGTAAIVFVGIPFVSLSVMLRLYHSSEKINRLLQRSNEVGQQLSMTLEVEKTLDFFMEKLPEIFNVDVAYILDTDVERQILHMRRTYEKHEGTLGNWRELKKNEGISGRVWMGQTAVRYLSRKQWDGHSNGFLPAQSQSVISVPVRRSQEIVAIITLASFQKRAYERHHLMVLEILANFLAVAVENARNYEKTKRLSERDPLTNLYNYRYFIDLLDSKLDAGTYPFGIILLDLDHFKDVNDTYGHEVGNQVLCQLAERLVDLVGDRGVVARYGGEEFVIILGNTDAEGSHAVAEQVRTRIAEEPFLSDPEHEESCREISITASIGVAEALDRSEDSLSLIRNADRAMYTGAKQKGKNRVSLYGG
ncbi:MAG TPA: sensor domain-containing diguanylate cyclase [Bacillales bacterium]|nr:sensor domain-containing diguanylate cyclase [Bacillales bacterium]